MIIRTLVFLIAGTLFNIAQAGSLQVTVKDSKGALISDAVVYVTPAGLPSTLRGKKQVIIDQQNKQFVPYLTAIQIGTSVLFPNKDNIRHHVYSFSTAKKFELPLYAGEPAEPVVFDKEGFVTLGCNIHDWMICYIAVLATPHFQITGEDGQAVLANIPAGPCTVDVWQPRMKGGNGKLAQRIDVPSAGQKELQFTLDLKPDFRAKRGPSISTGGYN